jgi:predicted acylesterase/phospholipase RssA
MASKKLTAVMMEIFGGLCVEDLWCPYFCVSSNLTRAEPVVHQTGLLWKSVRTSIAIPGVFSPILHEGDVLVDGGALNNFPVDIMRDLCKRGTVIGVNVSQTHEPPETGQFGASISGWQVLRSRISPFTEPIRVPTIGSSLVRALEIKGVHQMRATESFADLLIHPKVGHFKTLDFASYEAVSEIGYQTAVEQLRQWKEHGYY